MSVSFQGSFATPSRQVSSERIPRSRHPRWLRGVSLLTSATFVWSTVFALPARLWAEPKPISPSPAAVAIKDNRKPTHFPNRLPVPAKSLVPLSDLEVLRQKRLASAHPPAVRLTLLDETAHLSRSVSPAEVVGWKHDLTSSSLSANEKAKRHVWLGEWELARNENLDAAKAHFAEARHLTPVSAEAHGVARFDTAILQMLSGHYADARTEFVSLIAPKTPMMGYDRQSCALWSRHAAACEGYHNERSKAGIVEPGRLDPLCGAAGLAVYLKSHGMPFDQKRVLSAVRVTGRGSNLQDVLDGAKKLGLKAWAIGGDEKVMQRLPKPLVAFVEHDHFIAVTATDKTGVTYLCADCGDWPGGRQHLSWKQWRKMDASAYGVFAKSGTAEDRWLTQAEAQKHSQFGGRPDLTTRLATGDAVTNAMTFFVQGATGVPQTIQCGYGNGTSQCPCPQQCGTDAGAGGSGSGSGSGNPAKQPKTAKANPSQGDPVNLATLQEEYNPDPDLMVYNPTGPSVTWSRMYQSLRGHDLFASVQNFGIGWSTPYDYGVYDAGTYDGNGLPTGINILEQNGAKVPLTVSAVPTATSPTVACGIPMGYPMKVNWKYDAGTSSTYFEINLANRSRIVTTKSYPVYSAGAGKFYAIGKQYDIAGNYIQFNWTLPTGGSTPTGLPQLNSIADSSGTVLLTINRVSGTTGNITSISDRYNRSVYYTVSTYNNTGVTSGYPQTLQGISQVSQVVATGTASPNSRYVYGYTNVANGENEGIPLLTSITVPSPTGTGTSVAKINYSPTTMTVSSIVDGNKNTRTYTIVDANHTKVTITNASGVTVGSYTAGFDNSMSATTETDGKGNVLSSSSYASASNPYGATTVKDGNQTAGTVPGASYTYTGSTAYTYDAYGNVLTKVSPRGITTTYTYDYSYFPLGELTSIQEGTKTPTTLTYWHGESVNYPTTDPMSFIVQASGLIKQIKMPTPGTTGSTTTVTYSFIYDTLGNVVSETSPGNNAATSVTTIYNYTTDGTYTQAAALRQPLTRTDPLGHVTHMRYDSRANLTAVQDALGNETDLSYNLVNDLTGMQFPTTTNTSNVTGHATLAYTYQYPGGVKTAETQYNEGGTLVWQVTMTYGLEGEMLTRSGSTQPYTATYDALYRPVTVKDGNNSATTYYYKKSGYLDAMTLPGYTGATPTFDASGNQLTFVSGADSVTFGGYDYNGNALSRTDGRNVVTNYAYSDPESKPTGIAYTLPMGSSVSATPNVTLAYDTYGRTSSVSSTVCTLATTYDDRDKPLTVTTTYPSLPSATQSKTLTYGYYADGSRQTMATPSGTFTASYDTAGRQTGLTNHLSEAFSWSYLDNNWLSSQTTPNSQVSVTRNNRGFVTALTDNLKVGTTLTTLASYGVGYSPKLTLGQITASLPACAAQSGTTTYDYDTKFQLTSETSTRWSGYSQTHAYDNAGNPTTLRSLPASGSYTYNADNQRTTGAGTTYAYDGNGNPTTYKGSTLIYDAENRLTSIGSTFSATYRPDGLRASKTTSGFASNVSNNTTNWFVYDGETPLLELDASGNVYSVTTFGVAGYCGRHISTYAYSWFALFDPSGNTATFARGNGGAGGAYYAYDGFGNRTSTDNYVASDPYLGYGGQSGYYTDWETGLTLCGHRYYDSGNGRFLTRDPIGMAGGVNLYEYCSNRPTMGSDPSGKSEATPTVETPSSGSSKEGGPPCMGELGHLLIGLGTGNSASVAFCQAMLNCGVTKMGEALLHAFGPALQSLSPIGASIAGCLIGGFMSLLHGLADDLCNTIECPKDDENPAQKACTQLVNGLGGCADGIASVWDAGWLASFAIGSFEAAFEKQCERQFGGSH